MKRFSKILISARYRRSDFVVYGLESHEINKLYILEHQKTCIEDMFAMEYRGG